MGPGRGLDSPAETSVFTNLRQLPPASTTPAELLLLVGGRAKQEPAPGYRIGDFAEVSSAGRTVVKMSVRAYRWETIASGFGALGRLVGRGDAPPPPWDRGVSHRLGAGLRVVER